MLLCFYVLEVPLILKVVVALVIQNGKKKTLKLFYLDKTDANLTGSLLMVSKMYPPPFLHKSKHN